MKIFLNLRKARRALSPVIAAIFLMGVFVAAIGASLAILYPNLQRLEDQTHVNESVSTLELFDDTTVSLITQSKGSDRTTRITAQSGILRADTVSNFTIVPFMNGTDMSAYVTNYNFTRIMIEQPTRRNYLLPQESEFVKGTQNQRYFTHNTTTSDSSPWTIMNISRPTSEPKIFLSLGYRVIVENVISSGLVITTLKFVRYNFVGNPTDGLNGANVVFTNRGVNSTTLFSDILNSAQGNIILSMTFRLVDDTPFVEIPLTLDGAPIRWTMKVIIYEIDVSF